MPGQQIVFDTLDELGIQYRMVEHPPVYTMEDMEKEGLSAHGEAAKNLFLRDQKGRRHFLVMLRQDKAADLGKLMDKLDSTKLSFASDDRLQKHLGLVKGAVSPFGILNDENDAVEVVVDNDLRRMESIGVHPNDNTATLFLSFKDLEKVFKHKGCDLTYITL